MSTPCNKVYDVFFSMIEEDSDFFHFFEMGDEQAMDTARRRASNFLSEAIAYLKGKCTVEIDLSINTEENAINDDLNGAEIVLLGQIMFLVYLERDVARLKTRVNTFSSSDLKALHSPANERTSFMNMVKACKDMCDVAISDYVARDRVTGKRKPINGIWQV